MPSINKRKGICACGKEGKYGVFKIFYCEECYAKRKKSNHKSSGGLIMLPEAELKIELEKYYPQNGLYFIQVPKGNKIFASLFLTHYPESKGIVGRSLNYLIIYNHRVAGIIGLTNPPYALGITDAFFGITKDNRLEMNNQLANNHVFRLINNEKNLGSRCLRLLRIVVTHDWKTKYGYTLKGLLTFVEPPRKGSCYLADNWKYLGVTKGRGCVQRTGRWEHREWVNKTQKHIFGFKLA